MIAPCWQGLSSDEISARLSAEGTPLNRTSVAEVLTEEGFGLLLRCPAPEASISPATPGRDTNRPCARHGDRLSAPGRDSWTPPGPGCCWPSPTWCPWTCRPLGAVAGHPGTLTIPAAQLAAVLAGAEADPHPAGLPRR